MEAVTRPAAVAGMFYPDHPAALAEEVDAYVAAIEPTAHAQPVPKALIVPHAGYVYSGPVAGAGYARLASARGRIRRVVLLGPCHRVAVRGLALPAAFAFATPLGPVRVDREAVESLADLPQVVVSAAAHAEEHALEVQLPFLLRTLGDVAIVPLAVGRASATEVAEVVERLWGGPETLILVSSDLSHYLPYADARERDAGTVRRIVALDPALDHDDACGATPIAGLLAVARRRGLVAELLDLRNSGDTAGDRRQVVGYAAIAFVAPAAATPEYDETHGRTLLALARGAIREALGGPAAPDPRDAWLAATAATFVTLTQHGQLRGCIGTLEAHRPLRADVVANARGAAFQDPRFAPLTARELVRTHVEVSLLTAPERVEFTDREDLFARLRPGLDGLILAAAGRRATFLPQVWDQLPDPATFVAQLARKAGLPADFAVAQGTVHRYRVRKWSESAPGVAA